MAEEIRTNLVYLTKRLTNLQNVLVYCVQDGIITNDDKDRVMAGEISFDRNDRLFGLLMKSDWESIKLKIITIFRNTSNGHCANILEGVEYSTCKSVNSHDKKALNGPKTKPIFDSKWWPEEKHLPIAFLERKENHNKLIDILRQHLTSSKNKSTVINKGAAVSGMGGVGKTTIAKWFARHHQAEYDHIFWIDCGEENLSTSFAELAKKLNVEATLKLNSISRECFSKLEEAKCLFIYDNAECYQGHQGIRDVLPKHENFHTIITSRTKEWGSESGDGKIPEMIIYAFPTKDSVEFLKKNLKNKSYAEEQLEDLSVLLGNLPLALQIANTTINTKNLSLNDYIERIKQTDDIINSSFDDYEKTINKTMKISLEIIKNHESDEKQIAYRILTILGYISPDYVDFELFETIEKAQKSEIKTAMELIEKYSLITIHRVWYNQTYTCSIHRLLQQVIRHNGKEYENVTITKILNVDGFLEYKLLPYLYADEEIQSQFPKVRAELVDQRKLEDFLEQRRFNEAVGISLIIKDTLNTPQARYNYAVCLEKMDKLTDAVTELMGIQEYLVKIDRKVESGCKIDDAYINETGLWDLAEEIRLELVRGLLFVVWKRLGNEDEAHELINQDKQLVTFATPQSLSYAIKYLLSHCISDYKLERTNELCHLNLNNYERKMSFEECSFSEKWPNDVQQLRMSNVEILDEEGCRLRYYDINALNNLKTLNIKCSPESTIFRIKINENLRFCHSITLHNCIIQNQNGIRLSPAKINLQNVFFFGNEVKKHNEDKDEYFDLNRKYKPDLNCLNDFIDFQKTKELNLHGSNMWMKLDKSFRFEKISLTEFNSLNWNYFNCAVKHLALQDTNVPLLDRHIALRIECTDLNKIELDNCSVHLASLSFLSKGATKIYLFYTTIKIDQIPMESKMKIYADKVILENIKLIQNSVEVSKYNELLDLEKIKRLAFWGGDKTFDFGPQFSIDCLKLNRTKSLNWDKSKSSLKTLKLYFIDLQDIPCSKFRVTETLEIGGSVLNVTFLDNISACANKVVIKNTKIILNSKLDFKHSPSKYHLSNTQIKEVHMQSNTFFKNKKRIEHLLFNDFIDVSQLTSLHLWRDGDEKTSIILDMENISLALNTLSLENVTIRIWGKGHGHVNEMSMNKIPFRTRNKIEINSLEFGASSIDFSCLPINIQRIQLNSGIVVTCKDQNCIGNLNCLILHSNLFEMKYFSGRPKLTKVEFLEIKYDEFLQNIQLIPKSVKTIKLSRIYNYPTNSTLQTIENCRFELDTLIIDDFKFSLVESVLKALKPENVICNVSDDISLTKTEFEILIKLIESYKLLAIGTFEWESDEHFQNCPFSKFVDEKGEFYIFENQRGRVLQESEFDEMRKL